MEVDIKQAVKLFFSKSSFEMIYLESFANALDAEADTFDIEVTASSPSPSHIHTLSIKLRDNGVGFDDTRFDKFSKLLSVEEKTHKGLGRLVYLFYFDRAQIISKYNKTKQRSFIFDENFSKLSSIENIPESPSGTEIILSGFNGFRLKKNENISLNFIRRTILNNFYMKFYDAKISGKKITVNIKTIIEGKEEKGTLSSEDIPDFQLYDVKESGIDLFDNISIYYHLSKCTDNVNGTSFITALSIDDRSMPIDVVAEENQNQNYNMIFLLKSASLQGKSDESRQNINIEEPTLNQLKNIFRKAIYEIIKTNLPQIASSNEKQYDNIIERFPHLSGLIEKDSVGYLSYNEVIKKAQEQYLKEEREILGAAHLSDEQYNKSLEFSSRSLALYIVYRQKLIEKLSELDHKIKETELHQILSKRYQKFSGKETEKDIYLNNIWLIDDKFMSYDHVLSEAQISNIKKLLDPNYTEAQDDEDRPDISIFFSKNPDSSQGKFDVVIIELKRLGITPEQNSIVEFQLDTRTQQLSDYFNNRIERAWFYGIVELTDKYKLHLKNNGYKPLFSHGNIWYRQKEVFPTLEGQTSVIQDSYIMDFKALVEDAKSRNSTFLKILREKF